MINLIGKLVLTEIKDSRKPGYDGVQVHVKIIQLRINTNNFLIHRSLYSFSKMDGDFRN